METIESIMHILKEHQFFILFFTIISLLNIYGFFKLLKQSEEYVFLNKNFLKISIGFTIIIYILFFYNYVELNRENQIAIERKLFLEAEEKEAVNNAKKSIITKYNNLEIKTNKYIELKNKFENNNSSNISLDNDEYIDYLNFKYQSELQINEIFGNIIKKYEKSDIKFKDIFTKEYTNFKQHYFIKDYLNLLFSIDDNIKEKNKEEILNFNREVFKTKNEKLLKLIDKIIKFEN